MFRKIASKIGPKMSSFTDHKLRFDLTNELHARPFPTFGAPGSVAFLALKV